ncbi:MAG: glycosyltransferase family 2 protein [Dehalococcoidia bacterium]|nr:glycosyltransferase family 2 protein [Dehalococcoidia bacterium]
MRAMQESPPYLSIVVPAYNEEARLPESLAQIVACLQSRPFDWEVLVADDGSNDRTAAIVQECSAREGRVRLLSGPHLGKGGAVRRGMLAARGRYRFLADADLSMPIEQVERFLPPCLDDCDVAIASREAPGARRLGEPRRRHLVGRAFNLLVRLVALPGVRDSQCGFKLFTAAAAQALFPLQRLQGWGFDVEVLYLARLQGRRLVEVPIDWHYRKESKVRLFPDALRILGELVLIRWNHLRGRYRARPARQT